MIYPYQINICIADDQVLFRKGLVKMLSDFITVGTVREAGNGEELIELIKHDKPDMVFLDLNMPIMDGLKTCSYLHENYPSIKIIILSMHDSVFLASKALNNGAHGFITKNAETIELLKVIEHLKKHDIYQNDLVDKALKFNGEISNETLNQNKMSQKLSYEDLNLNFSIQNSLVTRTARTLGLESIVKRLMERWPGRKIKSSNNNF
jgi:DNA-binding NarL/FixJ family response regulator